MSGIKIDKDKVYIIIAIICMVLFAILYMNIFYSSDNVVLIRNEGTAEGVTEVTATESPDVPLKELSAGEKIKVHVAGEVVKPGVYELDTGTRVADALELAGGGTESADLDRINLAEYIHDTQQIIIPSVNDDQVDKTAAREHNNTSNSSLININTASKSELMSLPGIGEVIAENIIDYRDKNGSFKSESDIKKVNRIGDKTYENIKELITVD